MTDGGKRGLMTEIQHDIKRNVSKIRDMRKLDFKGNEELNHKNKVMMGNGEVA